MHTQNTNQRCYNIDHMFSLYTDLIIQHSCPDMGSLNCYIRNLQKTYDNDNAADISAVPANGLFNINRLRTSAVIRIMIQILRSLQFHP